MGHEYQAVVPNLSNVIVKMPDQVLDVRIYGDLLREAAQDTQVMVLIPKVVVSGRYLSLSLGIARRSNLGEVGRGSMSSESCSRMGTLRLLRHPVSFGNYRSGRSW